MLDAGDILSFWYGETMRVQWFRATPRLDAILKENYEHVWRAAAHGELDAWRATAEGCLALAIILDQLPLNMFRGTAKSFSTAQQALAVIKHALAHAFDRQIDKAQRAFLYMPLMHSENLADQDLAVELFTADGLESNLRFAHHHREIVRRFGRFPHRNAILGRTSTAEELAYLTSKAAFKG